MKFTHYNQGTCSSQIDFEIDDEGILRDVQFYGGCHGNLQGIAVLVRGMKASEVIAKLQGIRCGYKNTSCPDQLAHALREALANSRDN
ncbi:MAG: TIGR03905 family TSCPD domain-containing protein [Muribaculaceae bacterium]|nr:TIGR03905 family TSCPD domain-containing protein [Muribaculaceae bacterium]MBR5686110.1 TIGR03905 family TSCPD domain-containing protein [Muribaculaceae bacterium]